jgi:hypothetical protein
MDQRKKGANLSFFRNIPQGQPAFRETKKVEVGGKLPRHPPMECWCCKWNHRYIDFPHRNDKVRVVHNVQQEKTVEYMGSIITRIYATLDNKQVESQSHMIEV